MKKNVKTFKNKFNNLFNKIIINLTQRMMACGCNKTIYQKMIFNQKAINTIILTEMS